MSASIPFAHLHVASSHSLRYGTATPEVLVQRAAELGQSIIGLSDRNGLYAAVRWARECMRCGLRPVLGVDIAVEATTAVRQESQAPQSTLRVRTPARGGTWIDESRPRVLLVAVG